jgi:DNA-binding NarL/FixJ family response regulator
MYTQLLADVLSRDPRIKDVATASDSQSIKNSVKEHRNIQIVVLGSNLDEVPLHGIALLRELRTIRPEIKGVILLDSSKREVILEAFRAGARGLFSRHEPLETLSKCVVQVNEGQVWANSEQMSYAVEALALSPNIKAMDANGLNILSKREIEVVHSLAEGLTNREIASRLGLSQHTIKNYLFRIFDKLGVSSRMELLFLTLNQNVALSIFPGIAQKNGNAAEGPSLAWYQRAAENGVALAQLALARMYAEGDGMPPDIATAYMWYIISEQSCRELSGESNLLKRKLEKTLSPEQMLEARRKAVEKFPQNLPSPIAPSSTRQF